MKLKKPKKEKLSALKKKADSVFSIYIRKRDHGQCITCGQVKPWREMQAGHYISRQCMPLRYCETNVFCQCYICNCIKHGNIIEYREALVCQYGEDVVKCLESKRHETIKLLSEDYHALIEKYSEMAKRYE